MKIENLKQAQRFLRQKAAQYGGPTRKNSVIVGYTANYALKVHEDMNAKHKKGKTAKYLERPTRELSNGGEIKRIVDTAVGRGVSLEDALLLAGLRIQRESQKIVPVDTGNLKGSAFTRKESSNNTSSMRG